MRSALSALSITFAVACTSVGPETVPGDQFNYNAAIARSQQEQLLVNLVRLRYNETPVFLKVASMISQYSRVASVSAGVGANTGLTGADTATLGGNMVWLDRPTITYTPLSGKEFSENLLQPLPIRELFGLMLAGWPANLVMGVSVWSLNDQDNEIARPSRRRVADPGLQELYDVWGRLREVGVLGMREVKDEEGISQVILVLREGLPTDEVWTEADRARIEMDIQRFRELLGVDPTGRRFTMTYGMIPERPDQIAVLTGSIWDIMLNLAWQFEVPEEHVVTGRTGAAFIPEDREAASRIRIRFSKERPGDAFVAVQAQGYWFYIHRDDNSSKRTFSFLQLLVNLSESSTPDRSPLVTISS